MTGTARATLVGAGAVLLWSCLALLTAASGAVPPFELAALTFTIAAAIGLVWATATGRLSALRQPAAVWCLGVGGLFGYHALYFAALRLAPPAQAGLIAYLWPLLIVLLAGLLPGGRLRPRHLVGALLGLAGVAVLIGGRASIAFEARAVPGYALALGCALVWSTYSVLSRRVAAVPTEAVAGFCLATAVLAGLCHMLFETNVWPATPAQWAAVAGLGIGPVGLAFYLWDHGVKRGDIALLGTLSYAAPVLSTLILVAAGFAAPSIALALACALIVAGAATASLGRPARAGVRLTRPST